jgi:ribulose-bisphosphate carboxylase small chain
MRPPADPACTRQDDNRDRVLWQIGHCLRKGCVICIQHADQMSPRYTKWQIWGTPRCYGGDPKRLYDDIDRCREEHADHHIRLEIEDFSFHSRFSFVVHQPAMTP